jgi:hypothetical protein
MILESPLTDTEHNHQDLGGAQVFRPMCEQFLAGALLCWPALYAIGLHEVSARLKLRPKLPTTRMISSNVGTGPKNISSRMAW